jgi:hypothetical protein
MCVRERERWRRQREEGRRQDREGECVGVCERKGEMEETERGEEAGQRGTCFTLPLFKIELHNSLSAF